MNPQNIRKLAEQRKTAFAKTETIDQRITTLTEQEPDASNKPAWKEWNNQIHDATCDWMFWRHILNETHRQLLNALTVNNKTLNKLIDEITEADT